MLSTGSLADGESYIRWIDEAEFCVPTDDTPAVAELGHASNGTIVAAGIQLRKQSWFDSTEPYGWYHGTPPNPSPAGDSPLYIPYILTHELGHWLAVDHSICGGAIMYASSDPGYVGVLPQIHELQTIDWLCEQEIPGPLEFATYNVILVHGSFVATGMEGAIELYWEDDRPVSTNSFQISRADACNGPYRLVAVVPHSGAESYTWLDESVEDDREYWYQIFDTEDQKRGFSSASAVAMPSTSPPTTPAWLEVSVLADGGSEHVTLSWAAVSGASSYYLYRGVPEGDCDGPSSFFDSTTATSYALPGAQVNNPTEFVVRATSSTGVSEATGPAYACLDADVTIADNTLTMCPSGDRDSLVITAQLRVGCGLNIGAEIPGIMLRRRVDSSAGVMFASDVGNGRVAYSDTLLPTFYDVEAGLAEFKVLHGSGCGVWRGDLWADGRLLLSNLEISVRSVDQSAQAGGGVDRFDYAAISAASISGNVPCWDLDWATGMPGTSDLGIFSSHYLGRHHVPRKLLTPNGGNGYGPGEVVPITWQRGLGDSARVTLRIVQTLPPDTTIIAADLPDSGSFNWTVPQTNRAGTRAKVEVLHSAGYYKVDYANVGMDASDDTMTFHATAVSNLTAATGKNTAVLSFSDPPHGTVIGEEHEIWYMNDTPMTNANFASGTKWPYAPTPGTSGTTHCVEISSLTQCRTYYFGMRTKDRGVWSKLSNVAVAQTACSGNSFVFCEEGGLLVGGGGGEEELAHVPGLASTTSEFPSTGEEVAGENSLLAGNRGEMAEDLLRLTTGSTPTRGVSEVVLRESALREAEVDAVGLGVVAHPSGTEAVSGSGTIWVGTGHPIDRARDAADTDVSAALAAADDDGLGFRGGDVVTIDLGGDAGSSALVIESRNRVFAARDDSSGILVQRPDRSGTWTTVARFNPRREFDRQAIPAEGAATLRLVFLKEYSLRAIERLAGITAATPRMLSLADASHSRLGTVDGAVDRSGGERTSLAMGDTLALRFTPLEPESGMEHSYFFSIRGAVETAAETSRLQEAASFVVPAGPAFANALGAARPNPTAGGAVMAYTLAAPSQAELSIYNVSGRRIRTVLSAELPMGAHEVQWDGRDAGGRVVPAGVYFYRLQVGPWQSERKLIVLQK